jgi:deoxyribodipyrimidine photo-lyase
VPELRHVAAPAIHRPWETLDGLVGGYPPPIVDHATERSEALQRFEELRRSAVSSER